MQRDSSAEFQYVPDLSMMSVRIYSFIYQIDRPIMWFSFIIFWYFQGKEPYSIHFGSPPDFLYSQKNRAIM